MDEKSVTVESTKTYEQDEDISDDNGPSSGACDTECAQEVQRVVEQTRSQPVGFRIQNTKWRTIFRFFKGKIFKLPARSAIAMPTFGEGLLNTSSNDLKTDDPNQLIPAKTIDELLKVKPFWYNQPVPKFDENVFCSGSIDPPAWAIDLGEKPVPLPDALEWDTLNLDDPLVLVELYIFLRENYIEDNECMFRFDYKKEFLKWALQPPGWKMDLHCAVREAESEKLVGFLSATPAQLKVYDEVKTVVEMNFLCVHKEIRAHKIAAFLMMEMVRRVKLAGIYVGTYTAGVVLPTPIASCHYWLRPINPRKLIDTKFSTLPLKKFMLPDAPITPGFRKLEPKDCAQIVPLLNNYLSKFHLSPIFNEEDFTHWFTPLPNVIDSFVVETEEGSITDFASYFTLPFSVLHHPVYKTLKAAYVFYNVTTKTTWIDLMQDLLITAKNSDIDIFFALDVMDNNEFFKPLKFHKGYGNLHYYMYNWRCPSMPSDKVGLILY